MKEIKSAGFTNISFCADFNGGKLTAFIIYPEASIPRITMTHEEVQELSDWLRTVVLRESGQELKEDVLKYKQSLVDLKESSLEPPSHRGLTSLDDRSTKALQGSAGEKHISDAESVAHRIPVEKALAAGGMLLETKPINPIVVNIGSSTENKK